MSFVTYVCNINVAARPPAGGMTIDKRRRFISNIKYRFVDIQLNACSLPSELIRTDLTCQVTISIIINIAVGQSGAYGCWIDRVHIIHNIRGHVDLLYKSKL